MSKEYDLVILGGGTGGYVAAIRAAQIGMSVALVEAYKLGGTCLHSGCIPTKALLKTAEVYRQLKDAASFGINLLVDGFNFSAAQNRKDNIVVKLEQGIHALMKKNNIDFYNGFGRILGPSIFSPLPGTISVEYESGEENTMLVPKYVLIATGSKPRSIPGLPTDHQFILTSDDVLKLDKLPDSIVIVGGGVIGIEWASLLQDLGVQVTIIETAEQILMTEDVDIRNEVNEQLTARGVKIYTNAKLHAETLSMNEESLSIDISVNGESESLQTNKMLVSIGREGDISEIGLRNTAIQTENNFIITNQFYRTNESHIYAIGDCIGGMQLAHVASHEGIIAVEHMNGQNPMPLNNEQIPTVIYSYPEVAKVGLSEYEAKQAGYDIRVGKFPLQAIGKAHIEGDLNGFTKIITDKKTDDLLGVHIIGPKASELISEASLAKMLHASTWEIGKTIHPHPSISEIIQEAALATKSLQIHS